MAGMPIQKDDNTNMLKNENYESMSIGDEDETGGVIYDHHQSKLRGIKASNMASNSRLELHSSRTSSPSGLGNNYMKEVISSLHRATMASAMSSIAIRDAALVSLVNIVESENMETTCDISSHNSSASSCQYSLIVLQVRYN